MSTTHFSELPDPVYGSADTNPLDPKRVRVSVTTSDTGTTLLHAHLGGVYIAMTERNWQGLWKAMQTLEVPVTTTHVIRFNDDNGTASIDTVVR